MRTPMTRDDFFCALLALVVAWSLGSLLGWALWHLACAVVG